MRCETQLMGEREKLAKVGVIIKSKETPFDSIQIITNTQESKAFFEGLLQELNLPGTVLLGE